MTPSEPGVDWERVSELLSEALELPENSRDSWVEKQSGVSAATAAEVKSLIRAELRHRELSAQAINQGAPAEPEEVDEGDEPGESGERPLRFGSYETLRVLGRGGMGVVYLARRADGEFDRTVALKVIAAPFASGDFIQRFRTERQLLAGLTHPHIAQLLDGGVTADGDPYLVMEYIDGQPLDRYCDTARMGIAARLRLFLQLCDAVDFAHRNLILHRDLKPSNVLVTADGVVKLLDFGAAALIPQSESAASVTRARMLTPRYASPAQLRGERSSVADDVFSLGVILYELLTGVWPFGNPDSMAGEFKRASGDSSPATLVSSVTAETAARRGVAAPALSRLLAGDLSAIAVKSLEGDSQRRYASVEQFAADIGRYLEGRPVKARPQTAVYRSAKFLRRRWLPVTAAALFVAAISVSAVVAARAAREARAEAQKTEEVNRFLNGMLSAAGHDTFDPARYTVAQMLDASTIQLEKRPPGDPLIAALLHLSLAQSYFPLARWDKVEYHIGRAAPVFRALNDRTDLASGLISLAFAETYRGKYDAAAAHYREAIAVFSQMGKDAAPNAFFEAKSDYAQLLSLMMNRGAGEVKPLYDDLLTTGARDSSISRVLVAQAMANWAGVLANGGKDSQAENMLLQALATGRKEMPGGEWEFGPLLHLSWIYSKRREWAKAAEAGRRMIEITSHNVGPDSADTANARLVWARNAVMTGEKQPAVSAVRLAMPVVEKASPPPSLGFWSAARNAAIVFYEAGECGEAETYARRSLAAIEGAQLAAGDARPAESWKILGESLACRGRNADALDALRRAASIFGGTASEDRDDVRDLIGRLTASR